MRRLSLVFMLSSHVLKPLMFVHFGGLPWLQSECIGGGWVVGGVHGHATQTWLQ